MINRHWHGHVRDTGTRAVRLVEDLGLIVVLIATIFAAGFEVRHMISERSVLLDDLLLMFIYIEVVTMVRVYWQSGKLPVRMPMYIAMVALARYLIIEVHSISDLRAITVAASILILALAVLVVRYGHLKLPYPDPEQTSEDARGPEER